MNVLSLFDGMSCGRLALDRAGIPVTSYTAAEIDRYAIKVARANYPDTVHLGDVCAVRVADLDNVPDLVIGGSPCQGFSFAGKGLNFDDPRSKLFFEFLRIYREALAMNPDCLFMLENVRMKARSEHVISDALGVMPLKFNSALVSAQNRERLYWTNIGRQYTDLSGMKNSLIPPPIDRGIYLRDIIEPNIDCTDHIVSGGQLKRLANSTDLEKGFSKIDPEKAGCMTARQYANYKGNFVTVDKEKKREIAGISVTKRGFCPFKKDGATGLLSEIGTIGTPDTKAACINTAHPPKFTDTPLLVGLAKDSMLLRGLTYRKLSPLECERLQTVPDNYTAAVSDSQRYRMLGNGWTVDMIAHIFSYLPGGANHGK